MTPETGLIIGIVCFMLVCALGVLAEIVRMEAEKQGNIEKLKEKGVLK